MSEGILRQRRNLIILSVLIAFLKFGQVDINQVSVLGISFGKFGNPSGVYLFAWIIWGYFFYRYWQYFGQEGAPLFVGVYSRELDDKCRHKIGTILGKKTGGNAVKDSEGYFAYSKLKKNRWVFDGSVVLAKDGVETYRPFSHEIPRRSLWGTLIWTYLNFLFRQSITSDYLLSFVIALGAFWYGCIGAWEGSIVYQVFLLLHS